ncbi:MAG: DUF2760 domain-containing protein [Deltaproteobacteria bacterium]|nr:DUF2760 domain-containing protein [Deltaproteobacteria bacterium]
MSNSSGRTLLIVVILLAAILLAAGNVLCHALVVQELTGSAPEPPDPDWVSRTIHSVGEAMRQRPHFIWFFTGAPLLFGAILALIVGLQGGAPSAQKAVGAATAGADPGADGALRLLALLQQEGRLVDFLEEDIAPYDDAQVGAAVRAIHAGCRKALHERMQIDRIYAEEDGASVEVAPGFDAGAVRLTGNVHGQPPFRGVLQHGGWRASSVALPRTAGVDAAILAPAEVEIS